MNTEIIVISTLINRRKSFIRLRDEKVNGKYLVEYTDQADAATEFDSETQADKIIPLLNNPHDRSFFPEILIIDRKPVGSNRENGRLN
jgi:hypothetical protein